MEKYSYLKKYVKKFNRNDPRPNIWFEKVTREDVDSAQNLCGIRFAESLVEFWLSIGQGQLEDPKKEDMENYIFPPSFIAANIIEEDNPEWIMDDYSEDMLEKGYFPFFDVQQSEYFFWMKPGSDSVYANEEEVVEERFEDFIYNLYYIHPGYYWKKILEPEYWEERKQFDKSKQDTDANWHLGRHNR